MTRTLRIARGIKPEPTANELTAYTIKTLNTAGHFVWRQNNLPKGGRFHGMRGVSDVIGISKIGRLLCCEIKVGRDRLSEDQKQFAANVTTRGGIFRVIEEFDDVIRLEEWLQ